MLIDERILSSDVDCKFLLLSFKTATWRMCVQMKKKTTSLSRRRTSSDALNLTALAPSAGPTPTCKSFSAIRGTRTCPNQYATDQR